MLSNSRTAVSFGSVTNQHPPEGWRVARLGDIAEITFSTVDKRRVEGEVPVHLCNYTDVFYNRRIQSNMEFMPATATKLECERWDLKQGDVLFTKDSETPDEIGIPAYVTETMPGVLCGYHLGLARPLAELVDGPYLAGVFGSPIMSRQFARIANGVTRFGLTLGATNSLRVLLPPLPEQRAIANILDSIDQAIEATDALVSATEQLRDSLLHNLLTRGLPGRHTHWKEVPGLGTIPAEWEVMPLGNAVKHIGSGVTPRGGKSVYAESGVTFLRSQNVHFDGLRLQEVVYITPETDVSMRRSRVLNGDVLLNITGASIGRCTIVPPDLGSANVNQHVCIIRVTNDFNPGFVSMWLSTSRSQREIDDVQAGQSRQGLNYQQVRLLTTVRPSRAEQDAIATTLNGVNAVIRRNNAEMNALKKLKESALDALLTGRVRVTELGN